MAALTRRALVVLGALSLAALLAWASSSRWWTSAPGPADVARPVPSSPATTSPADSARPRAASGQTKRALHEARTLHRQGASAYHARLFAQGERVVLVTADGFTTFDADGSAQEHPRALGPVAAVHGDALVFWRSGSLREVSLSGQDERRLLDMPEPPRYLLASGDRIAWIHSGGATGTSLGTLAGGQVRVVYQAAFGVSAPVLHAGSVYWVALRDDASWNVGRVDLDGGHEAWSEAHQGRPPAMLAVGHDGVYFYAGLQRGVRRLTFGLDREASVASGVVCSPLTVSRQVVCAQVGGLFAVSSSNPAPRFVAPERSGPITALAVTNESVVWVAENGDDRLVVRSVALPAP